MNIDLEYFENYSLIKGKDLLDLLFFHSIEVAWSMRDEAERLDRIQGQFIKRVVSSLKLKELTTLNSWRDEYFNEIEFKKEIIFDWLNKKNILGWLNDKGVDVPAEIKNLIENSVQDKLDEEEREEEPAAESGKKVNNKSETKKKSVRTKGNFTHTEAIKTALRKLKGEPILKNKFPYLPQIIKACGANPDDIEPDMDDEKYKKIMGCKPSLIHTLRREIDKEPNPPH